MENAKILVVEDEVIVALDIQRTLEKLGYHVLYTASSGSEALEKVDQLKPDLVLMDIVLAGGTNGIETAAEIRARLNIPVVYLTAYSDEATLERAKITEPFGYVLKPFGDRELYTAIEIALYKHKMESRLKESERWLLTTINSIGDGVIATDSQARVTLINPVAELLTGWTIHEAAGRDLEEVFHIIDETTRRTAENPVSRVLREGAVIGLANHTALISRDGMESSIADSGAPIKNEQGDILGVVMVFRDIRERKRAEEVVRHNLEQVRALHEIDRAITSTLDLRTLLDLLLEKLDPILPYSATTVRLLNKESGLLEPVACHNLAEEEWRAEEWKEGRGPANVVFQTRTPMVSRNIQSDLRIRDTGFFYRHGLISYLGVPLIAKDEFLGVLSFYTKKEHEFTTEEIEFLTLLARQAAIAIHNSQLYEEIRTQRVALEETNRVKDEFLGVMSHELRTPLNIMAGYAQMINDGALGEINAEQSRALEKIIGQSQQLLAMINTILSATILESRVAKVERNNVDLLSLLETLEANYVAASNKDLAIKWDYTSGLPTIETDGEKLRQIIQNLIDNAIKFTERGSVTITVRYFPERKAVECKVADTGIGMTKEAMPGVFEKFRQLDSSATRSYPGVGLGLYIVKQFAELLGGQVEVESEVGKGSTFTVTIPCAQNE